MKITFFSNYLNHHQLPFCLEMIKNNDIDFKFVATTEISKERLKLGYEDMNSKYDFVVKSYENEKMAYKLGLDSDVVIIGNAPQKYILARLKNNKLTFRYSERIFKSRFNIRTYLSMIKNFAFKEKKVYLLCSSAYSAFDYNSALCYRNRSYKWGYFPKTIEYNFDILKKNKNHKIVEILWVGRFIDWKHPEKAILLAKYLKEQNIKFSLKMIGIGNEFDAIKNLIENYNLTDCVKLLGAVKSDKVRKYMENANIFLFTSDCNEGWGAVLNESMNSGCAVVASHAIGSVPFLLENKKNGIIYNDRDINTLYESVLYLIKNKKYQLELGYNAYQTILKKWCASVAASNLLELINSIQNKVECNINFDEPCSKAIPISNKKMYNLIVGDESGKKGNRKN